MLNTLGYPKSIKTVNTNNIMAASTVTNMLKLKSSKAWDIRLDWLSEQQSLKIIIY